MTDQAQEWIRSASIGWASAERGEFDKALRCYEYCDQIASQVKEVFHMNPELCLLRHKQGKAKGYVRPLSPTEDSVLTLQFDVGVEESPNSIDMSLIGTDIDFSKYNYQLPEYHQNNLTKELPHIMVMSTGRCGTVSLYHLFERTNYIPYHTYFFHTSTPYRYEMLARLLEGNSDGKVEDEWVKLRIAEWIGGNNLDRPIIGLNHLDTIFAPTFAKIHPESKFIHLRRDPEDVFKSFFSKGQWSETQLCPFYYKFNPEFQFRRANYDLYRSIAWYIKFTETFSRSFGETIGDRYVEISSNKLFKGDKDEIEKLKSFTGIDIDAESHFKVPYNEKIHKIERTDLQIEKGLEAFRRAYDEI